MRQFLAGLLLLIAVAACAPAISDGNRNPAPSAAVAALHNRVTGTVRLEYLDTILLAGIDHAPDGISAGAGGVLYLCDRDGGRVLMIDGSGDMRASFDDLDSRTGPAFAPSDVSAAGGIEVYVLDTSTSRILRMDRNLRDAYTVFTLDRERGRLFGSLNGLAFDRTTGDLFVTDSDHGAIIRIDMLGGNIQTSGAFGEGRSNLSGPGGIDVAADGAILIADTKDGTVALQQHTGAQLTMIGHGLLDAPVDVAAVADSLVAVADRQGIVILNRGGTPLAMAGFGGEPPLQPRAIAFGNGILWVSDDQSGGIVRFRVR